MEWISVKDRLPEEQDSVLLMGNIPLYGDTWVHIGYYFHTDNTYYCRDMVENNELPNTSHWMPLPKPPKN